MGDTLNHTLGHRNCPACQALTMLSNCSFSAETQFSEAADAWLAFHSAYIKDNTRRVYRQYVKTLKDFVGEVPLGAIHIGTVRGFQAWRSETACATRVNSEASALKMILQEGNLWDRIGLLYRPLPVPKVKVRQNMSEDEEKRLIAVALDKPRRRLAGHCLLIMANTTMGFGELRNVRRGDVVLDGDRPFVQVNGGAKNDYRIRTIPLNFIALRSMRWIIRRWEELGGTEPEQYILPHNATREEGQRCHARTVPPDFTRPMGHIYRAARAILKEAGLSHLHPYDMRSHAITKILSDPNCSDQVYEEIAGHSGRQMRMRYSKQRLEKKAVVMEKLCRDMVEVPARMLIFPGGKMA